MRASMAKEKWSGLVNKGKQLILLGDFKPNMIIATCETEEQAEIAVRELRMWSKGLRDDEEFKSLCQS